MSEKRKPGRPNTHLTEVVFAIRMSRVMLDQVRNAAKNAGGNVSAWLRETIAARLPR